MGFCNGVQILRGKRAMTTPEVENSTWCLGIEVWEDFLGEFGYKECRGRIAL